MTVDAYIRACQPEHAGILTEIRTMVHRSLPTVEECISYGMPTFRITNAVLFHIGKARHCCSIYPGSRVVAELGSLLEGYSVRKATIHLPLDRQVSQSLIEHIITLRMQHISGDLQPAP
jgi:uncharacterized protein YdhG (YjbR/CyaY superfamily)